MFCKKIFNVKDEDIYVYINKTWHIILLPDLDVGQVWGWGYGGEGQLGLGSRIKMVASPHLIPCIGPSSSGGESSTVNNQESVGVTAKSIGNCIRRIACGGRHSAVVTGRYIKFVHAVINL